MKNHIPFLVLLFFWFSALGQTNKVWVVDNNEVTTKIDQVNQNTGEREQNTPIIELEYTAPEESGSGGGGGEPESQPASGEDETSIFGIRNSHETLDFIWAEEENNYTKTIAEFSKNGSVKFNFGIEGLDGLAVSGGMADLSTDLWVRNGNKVGFGSIPIVQEFDFTVNLESQFNQLTHIEDALWIKSGAKIGIGTGSAPTGSDKALRVDSESEFNNDVIINGDLKGNDLLSMPGPVQIGQESPNASSNHNDFLLAVDGKIAAREVIVTAAQNWSDYVFNEEFDVPSLESTERFIKENGHLPNVPSEKEVNENGYNVHEMNRILLERIEVLTLQLIELDKKISGQIQEND